jgi:membrane associated rhomboid family serine protease
VIPLKDENPTVRTPFVTVALVLACAAVWFLVQSAQPERRQVEVLEEGSEVDVAGDLAFNLEYAAIPCEVVSQEPLDLDELTATFQRGDTESCDDADGAPELFPDKSIWLSVVVSMFLHGGLLHLGGNLLYLWIFGNNVEDRLGHVAYLGFYLVGGVAATLAHVAVNADSTVPLVGASGAIAAVMGAYLVWHPNARINTLVMMVFITFVKVRAKWLLAFWFALQFFTGNDSGVAWVAHVGGFVFGVVAGLAIGPGRGRRRDRPVIGDPRWAGY